MIVSNEEPGVDGATPLNRLMNGKRACAAGSQAAPAGPCFVVMSLIVLILVGSTSTARADHVAPFAGSTPDAPAEPTHVFGSVGVGLGMTSREGGALSGSLRPEVLFAPAGDRGVAFGLFTELGRGAGETFAGGGVTATYYFESPFSVSPSVGAFHRWTDMTETGYTASLLVGVRMPRLMGGGGHFDLPFGVRLDYRDDRNDHRELVVSLTGDVAFPIASRLHR